ncbi:MAG: tetratricopeptide repeat protein [Candidatus Eisenbacteria bacterium]|nr:tetratricopeptide repeat protein [Candidatus Eisenbacteria bacterium]
MKTRHRTPTKTAARKVSRTERVLTLSLLAVWSLLVVLGVVLAVGPRSLRSISRPGVEVESRGVKEVGDAYLLQGQIPAAIEKYERALAIRPDYTAARVNLAIAYGRSGRAGRGEQILREALETETKQPGLLAFNLGDLLERQGQIEEALTHYRRSLDGSIRSDRVWTKIGMVERKRGRLEAAREAFEKALAARLDPATGYVQMLRRDLPGHAAFPEAVRAIEGALAEGVHPHDMERYDLETIAAMVGMGQEISEIHEQIGAVAMDQGDRAAAAEHLRRSVEAWPQNREAAALLQKLPG